MSSRSWFGFKAACMLALTGVLAACGGSSSSPPAQGSVAGVVLASADSSPVPGATVSIGALSVQTGADGSFTLAQVDAAARVVLKVAAAGFVDGVVVVPVAANQTVRTSARLRAAGAAVTINPAVASSVTAAGSTARVDLPANSLVDASTGAAPSGAVTVRVTPIDPGADPQSMPGDFTASNGDRIESFGAVNVMLRDASGARLNLRPGSTATIRVPLASRSANPPATIPLYFMDEATGRWVQEGTATLTGSGADRYYEGTVTHFTTWNCDQPLVTIVVNGCVVDGAGAPVPAAIVRSVGIDYSGVGDALTDAQGRFSVPMRKGSRATIYAEAANTSNTVVAGPSEVNINLPACLVIGAAPVAPTILEQPAAQTVDPGSLAFFNVVATGTKPLRYQWRRNGVAIPGATFETYLLLTTTSSDNGAVFDVVVSNAAGSVTSATATLTVTAPVPPQIVTQPVAVSVAAGASASFSVAATGTAPLSYQWQRNGQDIAGATAAIYTIAATVIGDNGATFRVRVSNQVDTATSNQVSLTVTGPALAAPTITQQPQNASITVGQTAAFAVSVTGSPPPTFQWRRNGVNITGATSASYTTPVAVAGDNGALFSVVVSNSQGSVTSNNATLTVTANTADASAKLVRLLGLAFEFADSALLPFNATNDDGTAFVNPATVCTSGTLAVTLNGTGVTAGQLVPNTGTLAGTANACDAFGTTYSGSTSIAFNLTSLDPAVGSGTATVSNMRATTRDSFTNAIDSDTIANGTGSLAFTSSVSGPNTVQTITLTPGAGATLRSELSSLTATFASGSVAITVTEVTATGEPQRLRVSYNNLSFGVAGVNYVGNGFYEIVFSFPPTGSGEVTLTGNGTQVGRIFVGTDGLLQIEVDGVVQPFSAPRPPNWRR